MVKRPNRIEPGPGQESVWDYPRPPRLEQSVRHITIEFQGEIIVDAKRLFRILETSHPPTYYFSTDDVRTDFLSETAGTSFCEWKGTAVYFDLRVEKTTVERAAWSYPNPTSGFKEIKNYISFYPGKMDRCTVDGEMIVAQPGDFYGGWITSDIVGPFKGMPGTQFW